MTKKKILPLVVSLLIFLNGVHAQSIDSSSLKHKKNIFTLAFYKQAGKDSLVDFVDGIYRVFKINKQRSQDEKLTKAHFTFVPAVEYSLATKFATSLNANIIMPGKLITDNHSTISTEIKYTQNKQVISQLVTNIWLKNNEYNLNTNWTYLKYPQKDFGLGANSDLNLFDMLDYSYIKMHQSIVKRIAPNVYFGPGLNVDYHWNIIDTTTINKPIIGFKQYGLTKSSTTIGLTLNLLYDSRKYVVSPIANSAYMNLVYRNNIEFLGSDHTSQTIMLDIRKYLPFPHKDSKNILAFWSYNMLNLSGNLPYLDLPATASDVYSNTGRGYIQGRFRGDKLLFAESEYRFGITENGFIGGVVFTNIQSVSESQSKNIQGLMLGYGAGIRVKLNKHSNTNIALDYGIGQGGNHGIFMNLGEVF